MVLHDTLAFDFSQDVASKLFQRCVAFARTNLASWQVVNSFVLNNRSKAGYVLQLLKVLKEESNVTIRLDFSFELGTNEFDYFNSELLNT